MKILTLHCDYIRFKPLKKALKSVADIKDSKEKEVKECLVVLTAVESSDTEKELNEMIEAVKKTAGEVKSDNLVLYPYSHLSSNLSAPEKALEFLEKAQKILEKNYKVTRAPFGYYKTFELKVKGHPLSELSKYFGAQISATASKPKRESSDDPEQLIREMSRTRLDTSKLKDNDHRIFGQKLDLFSFSEIAPGSAFWHNNGLIIYNELVGFLRGLIRERNYEEISTPQILDNKVWKVSGHWEHYRDSMFIADYENRDFGVKPMNCPGAMLLFKSQTRSYKELPLRLAEFGVVHRKELSGVLAGLFRVVKFTQDDAHIFCTNEQIENEIKLMLDLVKVVYKENFGFDYYLELSTRPEKFMGEKKDWDFAEKALEDALKKGKMKYKISKGGGAFYGPKIDIHIMDSLKRSWQMATIQLDMQMPQRFKLSYTNKENKLETPIVIHRAILGSVERFIAILLEHLNGAMPVWLSPIQVRIINFTDRNNKACLKLVEDLRAEIKGLRIDIDLENTTVGDKVRSAEMMKIPYIIVIGDKEESSKSLAVRGRGEKPKFGVKEKDFVAEVKEKLEKRN